MAKASYSLTYVRNYQSWEQLQTGLVYGSKCFLSVIVDVSNYWQNCRSYKKERRLELQLSVCYHVHVDQKDVVFVIKVCYNLIFYKVFSQAQGVSCPQKLFSQYIL